jgi:hypothetical protein
VRCRKQHFSPLTSDFSRPKVFQQSSKTSGTSRHRSREQVFPNRLKLALCQRRAVNFLHVHVWQMLVRQRHMRPSERRLSAIHQRFFRVIEAQQPQDFPLLRLCGRQGESHDDENGACVHPAIPASSRHQVNATHSKWRVSENGSSC